MWNPVTGTLSLLVGPFVAALREPSDGRVRIAGERVHIALRGLSGPQSDALASAYERRLSAVPGVCWAAVNSQLGYAVVAREEGTEDGELSRALAAAAEAAERAYAVDGPLPEHPLSGAAKRRAQLTAVSHLAALPLAVLGQVVGRAPVPAAVPSVLNALEAQPRLRRSVERLLGTDNTEFARALLSAAANAGSGIGPGIAVDVARHALRLMELLAQQTAWQAAEPHHAATADRFTARRAHRTPREVPLRAGPVERYADRAGTVAVGSFGAALAMTGRPRHALGAAVSVIPKAPWLTRETFAATLARGLSRRGWLVVDAEALRRLDRLDVALLDTDALMTGAHRLTDLLPLEEEPAAGELAAAAHKMFDPRRTHHTYEDRGWRLAPFDRCPQPEPPGTPSHAARDDARKRLEHGGAEQILGLVRDGRLLALVGVAPEVDEAAGALVTAARRAGLRVLVTRGDGAPSALRGADGVVDGGERLADSVRAAQRDGSGVLVVSRREEALAAADLGVGLGRAAGPPSWGADVQLGTDPGQAAVLLAACAAARSVAGWGVRLAQTSAGLGVAMTAVQTTPRPLGRFLLTVNGTAALGLAAGVWSAARVLARPVSVAAARHPWHAMDPATVLAKTGSGEQGLTSDAARERPRPPGDAVPRPSLARAFVSETANPLTPILVGGAALSAAVGALVDASMILAVTGVSGLIGATQRYLADRTAARLYHRAVLPARTLRDGAETELAAEQLVTGDVVALHAGDAVPADCRLLTADGVEADESSLTGESLPVGKSVAPVLARHPAERTSMVYEGTTLAAGHARAVVVATGEATEAGRGAPSAGADGPQTGVEHRLGRITRAALPAALASAGAVVAAGLFWGRPVRETIGAAVGLAVASVPEGLPFLVTAAQLAAARRLAEHGVFVRDARTIEAAGRTDVLCFDKTGTLTHGRLELVSVQAQGRTLPLDSREPLHRAVLAAGLRATPRARGSRRLAHVTDQAIAAALRAHGVRRDTAASGWKATASLPFESSRGFHATLGRSRGRILLSVKGAPEEIVERCARTDGRALDPAGRRALLADGEKLAAAGHRVLAVAERRRPVGSQLSGDGAELTDDDVQDLDFLGFLALVDQVRGSAARPIRRLTDAGVHIVMITGDHPDTAEAIARELDLVNGHVVVSGPDLDALDDDGLAAILPTVGVVARATPLHKVRVVQAFQRMGRTVAMTGDGANDAPAIRLADVGIAFGRRATPAARAAADLVVTNSRLEPVLATLIEGRSLWVTVRQALSILVGGNLGEIAFAVTAATLTGQSPLTARQLLLVNLFTDLVPAVAVATRTPRGALASGPLKEGPEISLGAALARETGVRAGATALAALAGWLVARATGRAARARTVALLSLVGAQLGQTLLTAPRSPTVLAAALGSAAALAAVVQTPGVSQFFGCTPLGPLAWATAVLAAVAGTLAAGVAPHRGRGGRTTDGEAPVSAA